jgi:hypothetical protein
LIIPNRIIATGLSRFLPPQPRLDLLDDRREGRNHATLLARHHIVLFRLQELHVLNQHHVLVLGMGVFLHESADEVLQVHRRGQLHRLHARNHRQQLIHVGIRHVEEYVLLVAVIVVQQRLGDAAHPGQVRHRRVMKPPLGEQVRRRLQDGRALQFEGRRLSSRHAQFNSRFMGLPARIGRFLFAVIGRRS